MSNEASQSQFRQGWAVCSRDTGERRDEDGLVMDVVDVLRVFWRETDAYAEVMRLRASDPSEDFLYYYEETQIEAPPMAATGAQTGAQAR
jgi:hypothetical protein